jgi:hypothetical protein
VKGVLVRLGDERLTQEPVDLWPREGLDLALEVQQVALLTGGRLAEERRLDAAGEPG